MRGKTFFMATFEPKITRVQPSASSVQAKVKGARELAKQGKMDEAVRELEEAVKMDPNSKLAHMALGSIKARQVLPDDAIREFREVLRIDPLNIQAYLRLSRIYLRKKEFDKCEEYIENALRIDQKSPAAHFFMGHLSLTLRNFPKAKDHLTKALTFNPRLVRARVQMAAALRSEGNFADALAQLSAAARIEPDSYAVHENLGRLHLLRKDFSSARESYERAVTLRPENTLEARLGLVEALIEDGEIDRAEENLRLTPSKTEGRAGIHKLWGDLYLKRGLYPEAVEEYKAAQMMASKNDDSLEEEIDLGKSPTEGDLAGWRKLATDLKKLTDEYRDKARLSLDLSSVGDDTEE
jgi:tetratricopeptide (TPR) repeat protein